MKIICEVLEGGYMPERAHALDAGFDIRTPEEIIIPPHCQAFVDSRVKVEIPKYCVGKLESKSGLCKKGITTRGTIDAGYSGSIGVTIYNHSDEVVHFEAGNKITQLVIYPILIIDEYVEGTVSGDIRGAAGFGSTGK